MCLAASGAIICTCCCASARRALQAADRPRGFAASRRAWSAVACSCRDLAAQRRLARRAKRRFAGAIRALAGASELRPPSAVSRDARASSDSVSAWIWPSCDSLSGIVEADQKLALVHTLARSGPAAR